MPMKDAVYMFRSAQAAALAANVPARFASGPEATKATDALRRIQERRDQWPFPWIYPPPGSIRRNPGGFIAVPMMGVTVQVVQYQVDQGYQFDLSAVMFCAVTTGNVQIGNPGDFLWTVNRNTPNTGIAPQGSPLADLQNVPFAFGSPTQGPIRLSRAENFGPTDIIRIYATNVSFAGVGAPNFLVGLLAGWQRKA